MPDRAVVFIDRNNWYHSLRDARVDDLALLNYAKISRKLLGPREWHGTRYSIGQVQQHTNTRLYADQRRFLAGLQATDARITCHLGRIETHLERNEAARELREYLASLPVRIDSRVFQDLMALAQRHEQIPVTVEKAVDVMLAVDMVEMAQRDDFDAAYVLSADGDLTPSGRVCSRGIRVCALSSCRATPEHSPCQTASRPQQKRDPLAGFPSYRYTSRRCPILTTSTEAALSSTAYRTR